MVKYVFIIIGILLLILLYNIRKNIIDQKRNKSMYYEYYNNLNVWLKIKNSHLTMENFMKEKNIKSIAIYGAGDFGTRLYEELNESDIKIRYFTDKKFFGNNENADYNGIPIVDIKSYDKKNDVDAIIVTPFFYYEDIKKELQSFNVKVPIISLDAILSDMHNILLNQE